MYEKYDGATPGERLLDTGHEFQNYKLSEGQISHVLYGNVKPGIKQAIALFFDYGTESNKNALLTLDAPILAEKVDELEKLLVVYRENTIKDSKAMSAGALRINKLAEQNAKMLTMLQRVHNAMGWNSETADMNIRFEVLALIAEIEES